MMLLDRIRKLLAYFVFLPNGLLMYFEDQNSCEKYPGGGDDRYDHGVGGNQENVPSRWVAPRK